MGLMIANTLVIKTIAVMYLFQVTYFI